MDKKLYFVVRYSFCEEDPIENICTNIKSAKKYIAKSAKIYANDGMLKELKDSYNPETNKYYIQERYYTHKHDLKQAKKLLLKMYYDLHYIEKMEVDGD